MLTRFMSVECTADPQPVLHTHRRCQQQQTEEGPAFDQTVQQDMLVNRVGTISPGAQTIERRCVLTGYVPIRATAGETVFDLDPQLLGRLLG